MNSVPSPCPAFASGTPLSLTSRPDAPGRWSCTAQPASHSRVAAAARKARAREVLAREFPRLIADGKRATRSLIAGGGDELFARGVEFSFPMMAGRGRRSLKTLLWSVPMQAKMAGAMPRPCIEDFRVMSPALNELNMSYAVRCAAVDESDCGPGEESCLAAAAAAPRKTVLRVRTRLLFDAEGRIVAWRDSWDRAVREVVQDMLSVSEGKAPAHAGHELRDQDLHVSKLDVHEPLEMETRGRHSDDDLKSHAETEAEMWDEALEESDFAPGVAAVKVADALPPKGRVLTAEEANMRAAEIQDFLAGEFGQLSISSCGRPFFELLGDEPYVRFFHEGAILETPQFIVGGGPESVAMLHSLSRFNSAFHHSNVEVACLDVTRQMPRSFMATYLLRGVSRFTGQLVQKGLQVKVRVDTTGKIVHCVLADYDTKDAFFDTFSRSALRTCSW